MDSKPWLAHYDKGVPATLAPYPNRPLYSFLEESAVKFPDRACTVFKGRTITYREMNALSDRVAAALAAQGVKKGDRVGMFIPNTPQFVYIYYGILKAGGVVVATNPLYSPPQIVHQLKDAGIELMVVMSNFYTRVKAVQGQTSLKRLIVTNIKEQLPPLTALLFTLVKEQKDGHRVTLADGDLWLKDLLAEQANATRLAVAVSGDDVALLQYSGGTTGLSKGAIATHGGLTANTVQILAWMVGMKPGQEVTLMAIPMFHAYGMVAGMALGMALGATLVMIPNPRDLKDVLENIAKYRPTLFPGVPAMYNAINNNPDVKAGKYDLSSINACISGSAPLLLETKTTFERLTNGKLFEGYGLSEAPTATHCNPLNGVNKEGSIGMPFPDMEVRLVSLEDGLSEAAPGEAGELVMRGPQVFKGYWNMPAETNQTLQADRNGGAPWLFTGDIAKMDEDGYFYIVDRKKELIKPGGFQVWPRDVEEVIAQNPKVQEVGVAGVPDPRRGETVKAWVVLKAGETATADEIKAWCGDKLPKYAVPTEVEFRPELPKTTVGKVLRRELVREHKEKAAAEK
ncbi:MAG: long-chain fatty acid--CoA ligase [Anaerolineales bacterium]|nr:long-chain fatty acid--CoA ligase [Anaerolineales bacterium]